MRVSSATRTRIISSPEPGTCCIGPPVAQVPASSKIELVTRRKERISSPPPQISWSQKWKRTLFFGEVNVNRRQDGNGATGTTQRSLSQVPLRMQWHCESVCNLRSNLSYERRS